MNFRGIRQHSKRKLATKESTKRTDIQGLRMVAVLLVVLSHLTGWPTGGFIGVDVFFVISGFLITGSLLKGLERTGKVSFRDFYIRRIRRILPAATFTIVITTIASYFLFIPSRFDGTLLDATFSLLFISNWRFGLEGIDYFAVGEPDSPLRHYWSLSVEEQFYFAWPVVIAAIALVAVFLGASAHSRRMAIAGSMVVITTVSYIYAIIKTQSDPGIAYFSTLTRAWEIGVGALLALFSHRLSAIPNSLRLLLSWTGLLVIAAGAFLISGENNGFPGPWATIPVVGAALVIAAGTGAYYHYPKILSNRVSTYIGDLSFSLYLWHWPVIVILAAFMDIDEYYYLSAVLIISGLSIGAYHLIEDPIRKSNWLLRPPSGSTSSFAHRRFSTNESKQISGIVSAALATIGITIAVVATPPRSAIDLPQPSPELVTALRNLDGTLGPEQRKLSQELRSAIEATAWPELDPSIDSVVSNPPNSDDIQACGGPTPPNLSECTWGNSNATKTLIVLGDSAALSVAESFKPIVRQSNGMWNMQLQALTGCPFMDGNIKAPNQRLTEACASRTDDAIRNLEKQKPELVIIVNSYDAEWRADSNRRILIEERRKLLHSAVSKAAQHSQAVLLLAPMPDLPNIRECYKSNSVPSDCVGTPSDRWLAMQEVDREIATNLKSVDFLDTVPWYCDMRGICPAFAASLPTRIDGVHPSPPYARRLTPVLKEAFADLGFFESD